MRNSLVSGIASYPSYLCLSYCCHALTKGTSPLVFLRILEYYAGVLFLTTNRVGDFDEAFASRVHMSLYYPPLSKESTLEIFDLNLTRIKRRFETSQRRFTVKDMEIGAFIGDYWNSYPEGRWNGRQIRNACQTALALAEFEAQGGNHKAVLDPNAVIDLQLKHFQRVADAYLGFMKYMKDVYGTGADQRAKDRYLRADASLGGKGMPLRTRGHEKSPGVTPGQFDPGVQSGWSFMPNQQYHHAQSQADFSRVSPVGHVQHQSQPSHSSPHPQQGSSLHQRLIDPYSMSGSESLPAHQRQGK